MRHFTTLLFFAFECFKCLDCGTEGVPVWYIFRLRVDHGIIEVTLLVFGVTHPAAATCALCTTIAQANIVLLAAQ